MKPNELDRAIAAVREEQPEEAAGRDAARRVFNRLFETSFLRAPVESIRDCSDFQALIPAYLSRTLTPARVFLLEDHTLECVACRKALREARGREPEPGIWPDEPRKRVPVMAWALAATLVLGIAAGVVGARYGLLPGQQTMRATVTNIEGRVYRISQFGSSLIEAGTFLKNADELRTAKGSRAILRLVNGSEVEIGERSDISFSRGWRGTTVNLKQGRLIAGANDAGQRAFYVSAGDISVPVRSALLSLDRGAKGSRIAIAKGSARIAHGQNVFDLVAGQQFATNGLAAVPIASEFSWSANAAAHLALLGELSTLQKQFEATIRMPGLRYSSNLARYVPDDTVIYGAIPNMGGAIAEAKRMFDERLTQSDVLRNWWNQKPQSQRDNFDRLIGHISSIASYLGDEIVISFAPHSAPLVIAEVRQPGLAEYLQQNLPASAGLHFSIDNNIFRASPDPAQLGRTASGQFMNSAFYARIAKSYAAGAGYLLAVNLEQTEPKTVMDKVGTNAQYLVVERRGSSGATETRASVSFAGGRQGVASWLGTPGPMGSLDFVSPDASLAASFIMKTPRAVLEEAIALATRNDSRFPAELSTFESQTGINVLDDIAAPLGNDATFAIDGPLVPVPSWKLAIEVNDPNRLQQTIATLTDRFNQQAPEDRGKLQSGSEQVNAQNFYWLRGSKMPNLTFYYTFVDGYLLAGANETSLLQAIQNRQNGNTLANSANFRNKLPSDGYTNFSAVVYTNPASSFGPLVEQLKGSAALTEAQRESLSALLASSGPVLVSIYGEPDRIVAASRGSFLGFDLGTLVGLRQGRPLLPLVASSARSALSKPIPQPRK